MGAGGRGRAVPGIGAEGSQAARGPEQPGSQGECGAVQVVGKRQDGRGDGRLNGVTGTCAQRGSGGMRSVMRVASGVCRGDWTGQWLRGPGRRYIPADVSA